MNLATIAQKIDEKFLGQKPTDEMLINIIGLLVLGLRLSEAIETVKRQFKL